MIEKMKISSSASPKISHKRQRSFFRRLLSTLFFLSAAYFIGSAFVVTDYKERLLEWGSKISIHSAISKTCEVQCRLPGSEALPKGIVSHTSDLEMRSLSGPKDKNNLKSSMSLLAMAVGIKQKESVNKIVTKFPSSDFVVMLFHYDGIVDAWRDLEWSSSAIHVSAINQTKWWFAKRFLHPDIVSEYGYIFLWDEDLGVENFNSKRYISIIKEEGLEISQPALDPEKSEVHHHLTARNGKTKVHRRTYKKIGRRKCSDNSTDPPCTGFVEMMAPVFSSASWRCAWYMIQNDLVHAWGVDFQLGYCVKGDRSKKIGIVDSEYIVHYGLPTLGGLVENKTDTEVPDQAAQDMKLTLGQSVTLPHESTGRSEVRKRSYVELEIFKNRWKNAIKSDGCWIDPYQ